MKLIDNRTALVRGGKPLVEQPGIDFSDLLGAEGAVVLLAPVGMQTELLGGLTVARSDPAPIGGPDMDRIGSEFGFGLPAGVSHDLIAAVRQRLRELGEQWRNLGQGEAITPAYAGRQDRPI